MPTAELLQFIDRELLASAAAGRKALSENMKRM
jgi:hypothetical protein